ncbi:hypothetical protein ACIGXM_21455 [Kitasatospora sp. NPDC052896]|uniref:hypothetical protein n=1 Tax=Kitasatospora sp. NPDC052896 TaxID=3364061 RepID=UPI0037C8537B
MQATPPATDDTPAQALRTPRAAGVAGILFALLLALALALVRIAIPTHPGGAGAWLATTSHRSLLRTALALVPFAGVFFLWFMGAVRDHVGHPHDRFFDTLFLGSGLVLLAMLFVLTAAVDGLIEVASGPTSGQLQEWVFGRHLSFVLLSGYLARMAAVFTLSTTTIGHQLGVFPRRLTWFGYLVGLAMLFVVSILPWSELLFPAWALAVSCHVLRADLRTPRPAR